jgi:hypothetical protein
MGLFLYGYEICLIGITGCSEKLHKTIKLSPMKMQPHQPSYDSFDLKVCSLIKYFMYEQF